MKQELMLWECNNEIKRERIHQLFETGDIDEILWEVGNYKMYFIEDNIKALQKKGLYERALIPVFTGRRNNWHNWDFKELKYMFEIADPEKMRAAGDEIPNQETFTLYRGVAGNTRARRIKGISWTDSVEVAAHFAMRHVWLNDPAVFMINVPNGAVLAYNNERSESEYLLRPSSIPQRPKRIPKDQMEAAYQAYLKENGKLNDNNMGLSS